MTPTSDRNDPGHNGTHLIADPEVRELVRLQTRVDLLEYRNNILAWATGMALALAASLAAVVLAAVVH